MPHVYTRATFIVVFSFRSCTSIWWKMATWQLARDAICTNIYKTEKRFGETFAHVLFIIVFGPSCLPCSPFLHQCVSPRVMINTICELPAGTSAQIFAGTLDSIAEWESTVWEFTCQCTRVCVGVDCYDTSAVVWAKVDVNGFLEPREQLHTEWGLRIRVLWLQVLIKRTLYSDAFAVCDRSVVCHLQAQAKMNTNTTC